MVDEIIPENQCPGNKKENSENLTPEEKYSRKEEFDILSLLAKGQELCQVIKNFEEEVDRSDMRSLVSISKLESYHQLSEVCRKWEKVYPIEKKPS